jgi:hypothetical protein
MKERTVITTNTTVPIVPEKSFKYFLPNKPSSTKLNSGSKGIHAMYEE